ncbi:MAG: response regulator transcription factor [Woeseia sp.]
MPGPKWFRAVPPRTRLIVYYGIAMASGAMLLDWLEVQFLTRRYPVEIYVVILCLLFTGLGVWLGHRLTRGRSIAPNDVNTAALIYLGISRREQDVLALLAEGRSNQEIADRLFVSVNTVKTHLQNLYQKLDVGRRGQAVEKARSLKLVA